MNASLSRRGFVAGTVATLGAAAIGGFAIADEPAAPAVEIDGNNLPIDPNYVIDLSQGVPKWSFEIPPAPIPEEEITETIEDEIIVIGAGMSGFCCAASAAEAGASVTLFSASSHPISRGGSNFSKYNKVMAEYGIEPFDEVEFFYHEMRAASFTIDQQMWMRGYNNSEEAFDWMIDIVRDHGVEVFLERDNINDHGPNYAIAFGSGDPSVGAAAGQQGAVEAMAAFAAEKGAKIIYDTVAKQLIREDPAGPVTGVIAQKADGSYVKFLGKYIVMATGTFDGDKNMVAKYCPQVARVSSMEQREIDYNTGFSFGSIFAGDGQKMGLWIGAAWQRCSAAPMMQGGTTGSNEPLGFHQGLNVNSRTERFRREDMSGPYTANHLINVPGHTSYAIWTANYAQDIIDTGRDWYFFNTRYDDPPATAEEMIARWDTSYGIVRADTLEELANTLGLDAQKLADVIARYNELVELGEDLDFHKNPDYLVYVNPDGPFYAATCGGLFMTVMGGLNTNYMLQVCDNNDEPIPGLFNIGQMIGNMYANNYNFAIPGNSYGINCITFGYLLGRDLAAGKF
ncbi:MAG: FAD-dependent oxidoreductase [Coriobacteriales bacterium]|nr:FAD-dependent oxidoreductase [Coriobacteriales bacterium]